MQKKFVIGILIVLLVVVGGVFLWQKDQKDVQELNKNLPEGVKVVKSLFGKEYKVLNKIDGYQFKLPKTAKGISEINYFPKNPEEEYNVSSVSFRMNGFLVVEAAVEIHQFALETNLSLEAFAEQISENYGLSGDLLQDRVGDTVVVKTQQIKQLKNGAIYKGEYLYFFQRDSFAYAITSGSEETIRQIIVNGSW